MTLALIKLLRPHQWMKNALLFVPIFTANRVSDLHAWQNAAMAAVAFCLVASSGYIFNDLNDVAKDRLHPTKRHRPLPAGTVTPRAAVALAVALIVSGMAIASLIGLTTLALVATYLAATLIYTFWLKSFVLADVLALAGLYTLRIVTGAAAIGQPSTLWLLSFSMFLFFSLAMIKRHKELDPDRMAEGRQFGRDYALSDITVVVALGVSSGLLSVLVMGLYVDSQVALARYPSPHWLWLICPIIWYWCARLWFKAARREVDDDPVIYALRDRASWVCLLVIACLYAAAHFGVPDPFG